MGLGEGGWGKGGGVGWRKGVGWALGPWGTLGGGPGERVEGVGGEGASGYKTDKESFGMKSYFVL